MGHRVGDGHAYIRVSLTLYSPEMYVTKIMNLKYILKKKSRLGVVALTFNPSTHEAETGLTLSLR